MELIHHVKDEEAKKAREMEAKLLRLSADSGVLFVGVSVEPETPVTPTIYHVWVGCSRKMDPRIMPTLVKVTLREEVEQGLAIVTESRMGSTR